MRSVLVVLLALAACGKNNEPPPPSSGSPNAQPESGPSKPRSGGAPSADGINAEAKELFAGKCAMCHGASGAGDGQAASMLNPKPRDYTDAAWQASVTDDELKLTVQGPLLRRSWRRQNPYE